MVWRGMSRGPGGVLLDNDSPLLVDLNFPATIRLRIDSAELEKRVGKKLATSVRKRIRKGLDAEGKPLPKPEFAKGKGRPFFDTGKMVRSIKFQRSRAQKDKGSRQKFSFVGPSTRPNRSELSARAYSSFGLMSIQMRGIFKQGKQRSRPQVDAMGAESPSTLAIIQRETQGEVDRQLKSGRYGLELELQRIKRASERAAKRRSFRSRY